MYNLVSCVFVLPVALDERREKKRLETVVDNVVVAAAAVSAAAASASAVAGLLLLLLLLLTPPASGHLTTLRCRCPHRRPAVGKGEKKTTGCLNVWQGQI